MTAQEYANMVNTGNAPWLITKGRNDWTDSSKEQYFNFLTAEQANEMEIERWRLNNEYNTPANQMRRMIEAGINPAAAYQSVSSGNSSSAPNVHQPGSAAFHDTSDKLQRINTIMNGISSIMSTINQGVDAVAGIQGIAYGVQNNWYDKLRSSNINDLYITNSLEAFRKQYGNDRIPYQIAPGVYAPANLVGLYNDLLGVNGFNTMYNDVIYKQGQLGVQQDLAERRTRIDGLIQNIVQGLDGHASTDQMMNYFLQLFMYGAMSKFGGF